MKSQFAGNFDLERDGNACGKALLGRQAVAGLITFVASPPHVILYLLIIAIRSHQISWQRDADDDHAVIFSCCCWNVCELGKQSRCICIYTNHHQLFVILLPIIPRDPNLHTIYCNLLYSILDLRN